MSKRLDLRQFQQNLSHRMQEQALAGEQVSALGVQIGSELWLVEMIDIGEVQPVPHMTAVPLTKSWYCGVANMRGNLYSIVDMAVYIGSEGTPRYGRSRILLIAPRYAFNTGLLVNRVLGLRNPRNWRRSETDDKVLYEDSSGQVWRYLSVQGLLVQPEFVQAGI